MRTKLFFLLIFLIAVSSMHQLFSSEENWKRTNGPYGADVTKIIYEAKSKWVYITTKSDGIYRTFDGGGYWEPCNNNILASNTWVNDMAIDTLKNNFYCVTEKHGVFRSLSGYKNWTAVTSTIKAPTSIYRLASGDLLVGTNADGLYRSTASDNGTNWSKRTGNVLLISTIIHSINQSKGGDILLGTADGIIRGLATADNWLGGGLGGLAVYSIKKSATGDTIMAGTSNGAYFSTNNGTSWILSNTGLPANSKVISLVYHRSGIFIAGTQDNGVYYSNKALNTWTAFNTGLESNRVQALNSNESGEIFAGTNFSFYLTANITSEWTARVNNLGLRTVNGFAMMAKRGVVLAATDLGVYRTVNNGNSWEQLNQGLSNLYVNALLIAKNGNLLAGTNGDGLFYSTNSGDNWQKLNNPVMNQATVVNTLDTVLSTSDNTIYAGTKERGVFQSFDNGMSWQQMSGEYITDRTILSFVVSSNNYAFAGTEGNGLYRKIPSGAWQHITGAGISISQNVNALAYYDNTVYVAHHVGVHYTLNNGSVYSELLTGLGNRLSSIIVGDNGDIYCSQAGERGVFRKKVSEDDFIKLTDPKYLDSISVKSLDISGNGFIFVGTDARGCFRSNKSTSNKFLYLSTNPDSAIEVQQTEKISMVVTVIDVNSAIVQDVDVRVTNDMDNSYNQTLKTDANGQISFEITVPSDLPDGIYKFSFVGMKDLFLDSDLQEVFFDVQKKKIFLDVQPKETVYLDWEQNRTYNLTTKDKYDKAIPNMKIYIQNDVLSVLDSVNSDGSGIATYNILIPDNHPEEQYNLKFWSVDPDSYYQPSDEVNRTLIVEHSDYTINGKLDVCENEIYTYKTTPGLPATYLWTVGPEGTIQGFNNIDSVKVRWGSANGSTVPSSITLKIVNNTGGSPDPIVRDITIHAKDAVTADNIPDQCENEPLDLTTITVDPKGGTWSGPGVSGTIFDGSVAKAGTHTLRYTFKNGWDCESFIEKTVKVNAKPVITFNLGLTTKCQYDTLDLVNLATPKGGTFSGPSGSIINDKFIAKIAGVGNHKIKFSYTDPTTLCSDEIEQSIEVLDAPDVNAPTDTIVCQSVADFDLSKLVSLPCTFSGPFVTGKIFDATLAKTDTSYEISYISVDKNANDCQGKGVIYLDVVGVPSEATITISTDSLVLTSSSNTDNQWYFNDELIIGATSKTYQPTKKGRYHVTVKDNSTKCESFPSNYIDFNGIYAKGILSIKQFPDKLTPGQEYEIPITLSDIGNLNTIGGGVNRITAELKYNGSLLYPTGMDAYKPFWDKQNKQRILYFDVPLTNLTNGYPLGTLKFMATIGSDTATTLDFDNIVTYKGNNEIIENSVSVETSLIKIDVPSAGGKPRLYDVWQDGNYLMITPNPSDGDIEVTAYKNPEDDFKIEITDLNGQIIKTLFQGKTEDEIFSGIVNTDNLIPGVYFIILRTPWQTTAKQLCIIK